MATILLTGATGFVGRHTARHLAARGHRLRLAVRSCGGAPDSVVIGSIDGRTDWSGALRDVDTVVHLAGPAHGKVEDEQVFFQVNDAGTARLAEGCEAAGVTALVFMSSIAAREAEGQPGAASPYARSKLAGEAHVRRFGGAEGRTGIALRPPLVYGPDAPGNWAKLMRLAASGLPLPFASVHNARTLCAVDNLCDAIAAAVEGGIRSKGTGVYEVADRESVAIAEIAGLLRDGMGLPRRLLPAPPDLLAAGLRLAGKGAMAEQLLGDLKVDAAAFCRAFEWKQPMDARAAITACGKAYMAKRSAER
ncbi:NAD-dependent epimerase/dehydratase family protein [Nitratireductor luteus]|uniref:NAD-dependent epimerase/dehydratase family protein n=1 Tax=Nitratireductor luteus TaxID=2976980 RepID=UPI00223FE726|nr:NAD-dependent epimerase/dehydratase family protein [Nitratireductor luteus]